MNALFSHVENNTGLFKGTWFDLVVFILPAEGFHKIFVQEVMILLHGRDVNGKLRVYRRRSSRSESALV